MRKVIAKIDLENIRHNARSFRNLTGKPICAVVKANAYGHGSEEVVNALEGIADSFAVSLLSEALAIRVAACGKDILILTPPTTEESVVLAAKNRCIVTVGDYATAKKVAAVSERQVFPIRVHLKVNTGMNRYGMDVWSLGKACALFTRTQGVIVEGVYSHIYEYSLSTAQTQRRVFLQMQKIVKGYFPNAVCHISATYGATLGEEFVFDQTRIGIGLYGYLPDGAQDIDKNAARRLSLKKAMSVWAEVSATRTYRTGGVGYGGAKAEQGTPLTVARFGYADGFLRQKANGVMEKRLLNNLCMDACLIKGNKKQGTWLPIMTDAAWVAKETGTISYEVLCAATRRAEMVYENVTFCKK